MEDMALVAYELLSWIPTVGTRTMGSGKWPTVGVSFYALRNSRAIATLAFLGRRVGFGHLLFVAFSFRGPNFRALKFSSLMWRVKDDTFLISWDCFLFHHDFQISLFY
ncbi:hypothetical protein ACFX2F_031881 [Malus domestica]